MNSGQVNGSTASNALQEQSPNPPETQMTKFIPDDDEANKHHSPPNRLRAALDIFNQIRYRCGTIVNDEYVQLFIVFLIAVNAIMMGLATFDFIQDNSRAMEAFETTDKAFLIIFTIELSMQFIFHGWRLLLDGWLVFDLVVIGMSWVFEEAQIVRAFRIFRALRLVTRIEVMKNLVIAIFGVMPRMGAIGILLFLVSYIFAVMFTQLFKDLYEQDLTSEDYFGRMDATFFTLFQMMTFDSWSDITREVMAVYTWAWFPFISYIIVTAFIVVNLIIAVICDAISALNEQQDMKNAEQEEEEQAKNNEEEEESEFEEECHDLTADRQYLDTLEVKMDTMRRNQLQTLYTLEYLAGEVQQLRALREACL